MALEQTLSIIKPNATQKNCIGGIFAIIENSGLSIIAIKKILLSKFQAQEFYAVHKGQPFFDNLCIFMSSGPCVVSILQGEDAIAKYRKIMGATNPAEAKEGTIRRLYADSMEANAVHGSDGPATAAFEIKYFFNSLEVPDKIL